MSNGSVVSRSNSATTRTAARLTRRPCKAARYIVVDSNGQVRGRIKKLRLADAYEAAKLIFPDLGNGALKRHLLRPTGGGKGRATAEQVLEARRVPWLTPARLAEQNIVLPVAAAGGGGQ